MSDDIGKECYRSLDGVDRFIRMEVDDNTALLEMIQEIRQQVTDIINKKKVDIEWIEKISYRWSSWADTSRPFWVSDGKTVSICIVDHKGDTIIYPMHNGGNPHLFDPKPNVSYYVYQETIPKPPTDDTQKRNDAISKEIQRLEQQIKTMKAGIK